MEKSPARLTDEAENERRKLSRETQAATGPVPDAISTENEEQITAANLERRRKIECLDLGQSTKKIRPAATTNNGTDLRPDTNTGGKLMEEAQNSMRN
jgi:hypothetical protein